MRRLSQEEKRLVIALSKDGKSLRQIAMRLGRRKSTIYYHVRKNFGRKILPITPSLAANEKLGEFLGVFAADGCFYVERKTGHYKLTIDLSGYQMEYAERLVRIIRSILGKSPRIWVNKKGHTIQLRLYGKPILGILKSYLAWEGRRSHTIAFRPKALRLGKPFLKGVLRGLIAGDGSIYLPRHRVHFGVVSGKLAQQYSFVLRGFGIPSHSNVTKYKGKKSLHSVVFSNLADVKKFKLRVGLTDPAKRKQLDDALRR